MYGRSIDDDRLRSAFRSSVLVILTGAVKIRLQQVALDLNVSQECTMCGDWPKWVEAALDRPKPTLLKFATVLDCWKVALIIWISASLIK